MKKCRSILKQTQKCFEVTIELYSGLLFSRLKNHMKHYVKYRYGCLHGNLIKKVPDITRELNKHCSNMTLCEYPSIIILM